MEDLKTGETDMSEQSVKEWKPRDDHPSGVTFLCPHCGKHVMYHHGSTSASQRKSGTMKRCGYLFCPWCGEQVAPYKVESD